MNGSDKSISKIIDNDYLMNRSKKNADATWEDSVF